MKLYGYFRSSAAYRVRIALNLKNVEYELAPVHLRKGEQRAADYLALNPQGFTPTLVDTDRPLTQSLAILEYLDEAYPEPKLLPFTLEEKARVRAIALAIACDIHPINNLRILSHLKTLGQSEEEVAAWYNKWIAEGFDALETMLAKDKWTGTYCHGDHVTMADVCLVPQVVNAGRFNLDLGPWPTIRRIADACGQLPAFQKAHPSQQPDFEG